MKIIACNSNRPLAEAVAAALNLPLTQASVRRFADMEIFVEINENVRGEDVFVIQSTSYPANDNLMELLIMLDALRRSSAKRITAVIPYFGYARQDRKSGSRTPISAKLVANLIVEAGADRVLTLDLHAGQIQGFFDIPVDNLYGRHLLRKYIQFSILNYQQAVVVSPDAGGAKRATAIADALSMPFALIHKERRPTQINDRQNATMMLVGDVAERTAILIDDLADTSNTITRAAKLLKKEGATQVIALITHGILSGDAIDRINASALDKVIVTNTVPQEDHKARCPKLEVLEVGNVFAEVSFRVTSSSSRD